MKIARVIYFSDRLDTYADSIIALLTDYPHIKRVEIIFTDGSLAPQVNTNDNKLSQPTIGEEQERITSEIRAKISSAARSYPDYKKARNVQIIAVPINRINLYKVLKSASLIDVSATPKEMAINLVTAAIAQGEIPVCSLRWLEKIDRQKVKRIGIDEYKYENLTELREVKRLGRYYRANVFIVYFIAISVFILAIVSFLSYWFEQLVVFSQILNSLGVVIGFASLWLAIQSSRDN